ncbi:MAG: ABC transporter substrate-binding protein [Armatimonadetes bacterium]|nr:ABC transporter substrate-binding protein [Armatimonadota bacterium]
MRLNSLRFVVLTCVLALAGCSRSQAPSPPPSENRAAQPAPAAETPRQGGTLRVAAMDDIRSLDPAIGYDATSWSFEYMVFDGLVDYGRETELIPKLAEAMPEISPDGKTYTFRLRKGVKFHNGREVTSADFKYSIERILTPATTSPGAQFFTLIEGARAFRDKKAKEVAGIEAEDPYTLTIRLSKPDLTFLQILAMPFGFVVPKEEVEKWGKDFSHHAVGTGPFRLKDWKIKQSVSLARNPDYFIQGQPYLDGIELKVGVNDQLRWMQYERGDLDLSDIPSSEYVRVSSDLKYKDLIDRGSTLSIFYICMNCRMEPFTDRKVRQAVSYAVNRQRLVTLLNNRAEAATGILPPKMPGRNPNLKGYPYDPEKARQLLREAGMPNGFDMTLWVHSDLTYQKLGQAVQEDLQKVGVRVTLKPTAYNTLLDAIGRPKTVPAFYWRWVLDFPDPYDFLDVLFNSNQIAEVNANNNAFYSNPEVDRLLDQARSMTDPEARFKVYRKAEELIMADAPWVCLYYPISTIARSPRVRGHYVHPVRPAIYERLWLAE